MGRPVTRICFVDVETTSLRYDRRAWEVGLIVRDSNSGNSDNGDVEDHWLVDSADLDLGNADLASLKVGRFHQRHPFGRSAPEGLCRREAQVMRNVEQLTRDAVLVGINVGFDIETLGNRMRANGICPSWNYRPVDARCLAAGALRMPAPWDVEAIYEAFGVSCPDQDRHTAVGDARLARDLYDAVLAR